jgi:hypothetical protein
MADFLGCAPGQFLMGFCVQANVLAAVLSSVSIRIRQVPQMRPTNCVSPADLDRANCHQGTPSSPIKVIPTRIAPNQ